MLNSIFYKITHVKYRHYYQVCPHCTVASLLYLANYYSGSSFSHFLGKIFPSRQHEVLFFALPSNFIQGPSYSTYQVAMCLFIYWATCLTKLSGPSLHHSLNNSSNIAQGHIHSRHMIKQLFKKKFDINEKIHIKYGAISSESSYFSGVLLCEVQHIRYKRSMFFQARTLYVPYFYYSRMFCNLLSSVFTQVKE